MARTALTVYGIDVEGIADPAETTGNTVDGHYVANDGRTVLRVHNADGSNPHTLSIGLKAVDGQAVTPKPYPIAASATEWIRVGDPARYGTRTNINVDSTQLKITAFKVA